MDGTEGEYWCIVVKCQGIRQFLCKKDLQTILRQPIPSRLSVCFTRKAYSILLGDLCSPWAVWTVIDFALLVSDDGTIGSGRTAQKLRESKRHQKNMTT